MDAIRPYIPHDNPMTIQSGIANWLLRPEVLKTLGIFDSNTQPEITIEGPDGLELVINPAGIPAIGYATSVNGKKWFRAGGNSVLVADGEGFDAIGVSAPVVRREDGLWVMYYAGAAEPGGRTRAIGRAEAASPDGPWIRAEDPVIIAGDGIAWDSLSITPGSFLESEERLRLFHSGFSELASLNLPTA